MGQETKDEATDNASQEKDNNEKLAANKKRVHWNGTQLQKFQAVQFAQTGCDSDWTSSDNKMPNLMRKEPVDFSNDESECKGKDRAWQTSQQVDVCSMKKKDPCGLEETLQGDISCVTPLDTGLTFDATNKKEF